MKTETLAILLTLTILLSTFIPVIRVEATGGSSLGGLWRFDEGDGIVAYDGSGNGNDGAVHGASWTGGKYGKALSFDGMSNYVEVPDSASLDITGKITIEAWIYPRSLTGAQVIVCKYNHTSLSSAFYLSLGGTLGAVTYLNKIYFALSYDGNHYYAMVSNTNITANTWTHIAATSNSTHMALYINGVKDNIRTYPSGTIYVSSAALRIGCYLPEFGYPRFFNGTIDEVKVSPGVVWTVDDDRVECPNADFTGIQAAINASSSGDTIMVHNGTYNEALYISKSLDIEAASTPVIRGGQMRTTNRGSRQATVFVKNAVNVLLEGLDVEGQGLGVPAGTKSYAILYENSSGAVQDCIASPNTVGDMGSVAIAAQDDSNVAIRRCAIDNFGRIGVYSDNATLTVQANTIVGQTYSLDGQVNYGIEIEDYSGASVAQITNNEIYDCDNTNSTPLWSSAAVIVDIWKGWFDLPSSTVSIGNNNIHDNFEAIEITGNALSNAHYNDIHDNRYGVWVNPDLYNNNVTFDARFNWWGDASGPNQTTTNPAGTGNDVGDYVDYSPWLGFVVGTSPMTWHVNPTGTIQEAINEASPGDTVTVHAGTYDEAVNVNKTLTLQSASRPVIQPDNTTPLYDGGIRRPAIYITADNVVIKGFEIDGTHGIVHHGIYGLNTNGLLIQNNLIHDITNQIGDPGDDVAGVGILIFGWDSTVNGNVVLNNTVYNTGRMGIFIGGMESTYYTWLISSGNTISDNIVYHTWQGPTNDYGAAVQLNGAKDSSVSGNNIYDTGNNQRGIYLLGSAAGSANTIAYNNVYDNARGIQFWIVGGGNVAWGTDTPAAPEVHYNNIYGNPIYGLNNYNATGETPIVVNATNNWWGNETGPYHSTSWTYMGSPYGPHYGLGDKVSDYVLYYPWLNASNGMPVQPPKAAFTYSPTMPIPGQPITFDASGSTPSGTIVSYSWDFGDANTTTTSNPTITHAYSSPGAYNVNLTVTDGFLTNSTSQTLTIYIHDVAVTNITVYTMYNRTYVYQGMPVNITVTVKNNGDFPENVNVTLFYNITANEIIGTQVVGLGVGESKTLPFMWNTVGVPYCHNYTLTAVATIPADFTLADNTLSDGKIRVRIMGDVNGDGIVDMMDISYMAMHFMSIPGDPAWNPNADINCDGIVDMMDIALAAQNFFRSC